MKDALVIMIKNPVLGKVKTRLAAETGDERALKIYLELLRYTESVASKISADRFVFYSDVVERRDLFLNDHYKKYTQCSGDLGARMEYAFSIPFKDEYKKVIMIGSDCFELTTAHIEAAFSALDANDFVIGPAKDGGYYLIGMKKWNRWITQNKNWSTATVFEETKQEIEGKNGKLFLLEELSDVDTLEDLKLMEGLNQF